MFVEPPVGAGTVPGAVTHPVDLVLDAFRSPESWKATGNKLRVFLEETMRMHETKLDLAPIPATGFELMC